MISDFGESEGHRYDSDFLALCERIQGKEVELIFIGDDAFEKDDNNYWLTPGCYTILESAADGKE